MASVPDLVVKIVAVRSTGSYQAYVGDRRGRARIAYGYPCETWDEARVDAEALAELFRQHGHTAQFAVRRSKAEHSA